MLFKLSNPAVFHTKHRLCILFFNDLQTYLSFQEGVFQFIKYI